MSGTQTTQEEAGGSSAGGDSGAGPDQAVLERARRMGWRPKEEYTGDPTRWQEPEAFVERAETMLPLAVARNRKLEQQVEALTGQMNEAKTLMVGMVERTRRAEEIGYKRARREIEAERSRAVASGDTEAFNAAEEKLRDLGPAPEAAAAPPARTAAPPAASTHTAPQPAMDPVVEAWIGQNQWFRSNPEANAVAVALHGVIAQQNPSWTLEEKLAETTRRVRQRMPEVFGASHAQDTDPPPANARRTAPSAVSPSQSAATRAANPRSFDAMPAEVRRQYDRQARMLEGKGEAFTKEEFARYYWEQFEEVA